MFPRLWGLYRTGSEMTLWMKMLAPKHDALRLVLGTHRLERTESRRLTSGLHTHEPNGFIFVVLFFKKLFWAGWRDG